MLNIFRFKTDLFEENCYIVTVPEYDEALIVDPGMGSAAIVDQELARLGKSVGAVLLTHGHPDHVWDAAAVSTNSEAAEGSPVYIPRPDRVWLEDASLRDSIVTLPHSSWIVPNNLQEAPMGPWQILPGIVLQMVLTPGHSRGSAIFLLAGPAQLTTDSGFETTLQPAFSGDVVFAGAVGRTDLPGGDEEQMRSSLRLLANILDPQTDLLPGHGKSTNWQVELESNPYVRRALS